MNPVGIGIDLGGTKCTGALFSEKGEILFRETIPVAGLEGIEVGKTVGELAHKLWETADNRNLVAKGLCVSVPGIADQASGTVWAPNIPGWEKYPLKSDLQRIFGNQLAIIVDNDRTCSILGETWLGSAGGCRDAIFLAVGTGIGAGIISSGNIIRGARDIAGAVGWMALDSDYITGYARYGSFEYNASGDGLVRVAHDLILKKKFPSSVLKEDDLDTRTIFRAYDLGDALAHAVIRNAISYWGKAVANLVSLFDPEVIIFGGGVFGPGIPLLESIHAEAKKWAQPVGIQKVLIRPSALGQGAAVCGAGKTAIEIANST
jgi:glucokinase